MQPIVEVCFSPVLYGHKLTNENFVTAVVDILRATTSIVAAFDHGVAGIFPVSGLDEARDMKEKGYIVACERNGEIMDFADTAMRFSKFFGTFPEFWMNLQQEYDLRKVKVEIKEIIDNTVPIAV